MKLTIDLAAELERVQALAEFDEGGELGRYCRLVWTRCHRGTRKGFDLSKRDAPGRLSTIGFQVLAGAREDE